MKYIIILIILLSACSTPHTTTQTSVTVDTTQPVTFFPDKCIISDSFSCLDFKSEDSTIEIMVQNNFDRDLDSTNMVLSACKTISPVILNSDLSQNDGRWQINKKLIFRFPDCRIDSAHFSSDITMIYDIDFLPTESVGNIEIN